MNEFKNCHPLVNFIFFISVILLTMFFMHPVIILISFAGAFWDCLAILGREKTGKLLRVVIPVFVLTAIVNPLFSHEGVTVLWYFPGGNPLTAESVFFGAMSGVMIADAILWFSCLGEVLSGDKIIYLFGKVSPSISLLFSMILHFVPSFTAHIKKVSSARECMGKSVKEGNFSDRAKDGLIILSAATTYALESSVETADSMKSRGYGCGKRTTFSLFRFYKRDIASLVFIVISAVIVLLGNISGILSFGYFPSVSDLRFGIIESSVFFIWFLLCIYPAVYGFWEVRRWSLSKSKI